MAIITVIKGLGTKLKSTFTAVQNALNRSACFGGCCGGGTAEGGSRVKTIRRFWHCESGATAVEYGLIAAGIAVVVIGALKSLGKDLTATFKSIRKALK